MGSREQIAQPTLLLPLLLLLYHAMCLPGAREQVGVVCCTKGGSIVEFGGFIRVVVSTGAYSQHLVPAGS